MRDSQPKSEFNKYINGGKNPNYLVRSWASSLGTVTQGHKVPKSDYRSKWLQRLNRVELMQNVEVQQTLRNVMSILKDGDELIQDSDSAYEFAERRRIEKCHEAVCKIRADNELRKRLSKPEAEGTNSGTKLSHKQRTVKIKNQKLNLPISSVKELDSTKVNKKFTKISVDYDSDKSYENLSGESTQNSNKLFTNQGENQDERKVLLPPIPEASPENALHKRRKEHRHFSLPTLDAESKFCIIKRAKELRHERDAKIRNQSLTTMSSEINRKYSKTRKISLKNYRKIEIFGDNRKLLDGESKVVAENRPTALPLLDSKSFSEIDCNDFLNVKNRLDGLSPTPAVLDHKLHWPTKAHDK